VTKTGTGTLQVSKLPQAHAMTISAGTVRILESSPGVSSGHPSGDNAFVSQPSSLAIAPGGTLDLTNNDLILDYSGDSPVATYEALVASGYNVTYGQLKYPADVDVLMIAPRMIGTGVRNTYVDGTGFPSLVAVHQDASGDAHDRMLAISKAIGTLMRGAFASSCDEETLCDLFNEHFGYVYSLRRAYELLVEAGASPEAALLEFWASGEEMELARVHMTHGLFHQLVLHSQTSQYGQEITGRLSDEEEKAERERLRRLIRNITDGTFARDWALEQKAGMPRWSRVRRENLAHPMIAEEERLLRTLGVLERGSEGH